MSVLNIVIPMAGRGSRFRDKGYEQPKPFIPVHGVPMIKVVIENLRPSVPHRFIFLCLQEHIEAYDLHAKLKAVSPDSIIVPVSQVTEGAACTVLLAEKYIDSAAPLMIANSDQWVDLSIDDYLAKMEAGNYDGYIMTMTARDPKWSFIHFGDDGSVIGVVEKQVVSEEATVGIYNFRHGSDFVRLAKQMIAKNLRVNGEFYVAPVYSELAAEGKTIGYCNIGSEHNGMYGLGIPSDLESFLQLSVSRKAVSGISQGL